MFNKVLSFYKEIQPKQCQFDEFKMMQVQRQPSSERVLKPQRSYGNHRFGVTANVASGLRQMPLRNRQKYLFSDTAKNHVLMLEEP
ncbi:MAG: hypothetical protein HXN56_06720 [Prevotella nigrescens]|nr:hypothetical protein [Prevotella nigrescens]